MDEREEKHQSGVQQPRLDEFSPSGHLQQLTLSPLVLLPTMRSIVSVMSGMVAELLPS
jgi:hypothetical protein